MSKKQTNVMTLREFKITPEKLLTLLKTHDTFAEVAEYYNLDYGNLRVYASRHKIKNPNPEYERDTSNLLLGRKKGLKKKIKEYNSKKIAWNSKMSDQELLDEIMRDTVISQKINITKLAKKFEVTRQTIYNKIQKLKENKLL